MFLGRLVLIDGNSILNRAFYGILGNKMLMTPDGIPTNAVYGFLAILFKIMDDLKPEYLAVAFDMRAPTYRHKLYEGYKAKRKGMPDELAQQMPIIKEILTAMNIKIVEMEGYEADDIIGTLARYGSKRCLDVTILSGDRDTFQLITEKINVRIPHTKGGKTETEDYDMEKIKEKYGLKPRELIEVKGLMGDSSDNIPGVPGVGEKTALDLIKRYKNIDNLYEKLEAGQTDIKGRLLERLLDNKELAYLSKKLGKIDLKVPLEKSLEPMRVEPWDNEKVFEMFSKLKFNRYIDRFSLDQYDARKNKKLEDIFKIEEIDETNLLAIQEMVENVQKEQVLYYYLGTSESSDATKIIKEEIRNISIYNKKENKIYYIRLKNKSDFLKKLIEDPKVLKCSYKLKEDYILFRQAGINPQNLMFDVEIAAYILNSIHNSYALERLSDEYLKLDVEYYINQFEESQTGSNQINLFEEIKEEKINTKNCIYSYCIGKLHDELKIKLEESDQYQLFVEIEMPIVEVLADMQYEGMYVDRQELLEYGKILKARIDELTQEVYQLAGVEFNLNSPKQLGEVLYEKLHLTTSKKNKKGYSTDVDALEKIKEEHPVIDKILEYRQIMKLYSTYVEGLIPFINSKTQRVHSYFHQTVTATGRISSTEPNLQNIPTRFEIGKALRKVFKAEEGRILVDADYSQIELRVLAHISNDEEMIHAFNENHDIHKEAASKVFDVPLEEVTPEQRTKAKAVNFGIVYGISDFGLGERLNVPKREAKQYIEQYLSKYHGIRQFMEEIVDKAKENGYVETLFKRKRYIPELESNNYMVRQFGKRVALNTPIQGTAADIMKIAMIHVYTTLKRRNLKSKLILQVHDELIIETVLEEKEEVKKLLKDCMESVIKLKVPLVADLSEAESWYEAK